jgi:hypothetical protein
MPEINAQTDATNMIWKLIDDATGRANADIDWSFRVGDRVKIRLVNTMDSDHPMHHPFHAGSSAIGPGSTLLYGISLMRCLQVSLAEGERPDELRCRARAVMTDGDRCRAVVPGS